MSVYRRSDSGVYWYDFTVDGIRYRGSTKEKKVSEARAVEASLIARKKRHGVEDVLPVRVPVLREFAVRFLEWVQSSRLERNSKRYYVRGWGLLSSTRLAAVQMSRIASDTVETTRFRRIFELEGTKRTGECSAQYTNQALRTLRRMFSKAQEWGLIAKAPRIRLLKVYGRDTLIDPATERLLLQNLAEPVKSRRVREHRDRLRDFLVIAQDSGMRPEEILRMRIEHIDWDNFRIWNPYGKTAKSRRFVLMSLRMRDLLFARCAESARVGFFRLRFQRQGT